MNIALKAVAWTWRFKETKNDSLVERPPGSHNSPVLRTILDFQRVTLWDSPVLRTPGVSTPRHLGHWGVSTPWYIGHRGVLTHKVLKSLDSSVLRTPGSLDSPVARTSGSFDSPVLRTPGSLDSPVHRTPGSHFKMLITQPRSKKNRNAPRTSLMGPGGAVWGKKPSTKNLVRMSLYLYSIKVLIN